MDFSRLFALVGLLLSSFGSMAGTICIGAGSECNETAPILVENGNSLSTIPEVNGTQLQFPSGIYVDGNLFLDYSIFTLSQDLEIGQDFSISGKNVTIFGYNNTTFFPEQYNSYLATGGLFGNYSGDWVFFSTIPLASGDFVSSGNIYIGNYSSIAPVPLPPSILLFLSGLLFLKIPLLNFHAAANKSFKRTALRAAA